MNEITLTVVAQILNFLVLWYILHTLLLKKVFGILQSSKEEIKRLENLISLIKSDIQKEEDRKKHEWQQQLALFAHQTPYKKTETLQQDITPLCPVAPGIKKEEEEKLIDETVAHLVRKIIHEY